MTIIVNYYCLTSIIKLLLHINCNYKNILKLGLISNIARVLQFNLGLTLSISLKVLVLIMLVLPSSCISCQGRFYSSLFIPVYFVVSVYLECSKISLRAIQAFKYLWWGGVVLMW